MEPSDQPHLSSEAGWSAAERVGLLGLLLIGSVAVAVLFVAGVGRDPVDDEPVSGTVTSRLPGRSAAAPITEREALDAAGQIDSAASRRPSVRVLRPPSSEEGPVALMPFPEGTAEADDELFVLDGGGVRSRTDLPLWPSDSPDPIVMGSGEIVFVTLEEGYQAFTVPADLWSRDPKRIAPGSYLVPGAGPDQVWIVDDDERQVTGLGLASGNLGEVIALPDTVRWVHAATSDGLVVSVDADAVAPEGVALLGRTLEPLASLPAEWASQPPEVVTGGGDRAVLGWDGYLAVVDVTRDRLVYFTDPGPGRLLGVCLSPDQGHLAIKGDTELQVVDLADGGVVEFPADEGFNGAAWTSRDRLVLVHDGFLDVLGVDGEVYSPLAELGGSAHWSVAAVGHSC
jgi:hypothetical protein